MKKIIVIKTLIVAALIGCMFTAPVVLTGCTNLKPVPIAVGEDPVVVNAERAQTSSLAIYQQVIKWEFDNRANLPASVSRAVDKVRSEFPGPWRQSRRALFNYKAKTGGVDATSVQKMTAALSVAQGVLLQLQLQGSGGDLGAVTSSLISLANSVKVLSSSPAVPSPVQP